MIERYFLETPRSDEGYYLFSDHRKFQHDEKVYDAQYSVNPSNLTAGAGVLALTQLLQIDTNHIILELGCGTGLLSVGLLKVFNPEKILITDASSTFLDISREKFLYNAFKLPHLGVLRFEEIHKLPQHAFSLILIRSALHHIEKYDDFLMEAAKKLVPNGAILFQEPLYEGLFIMGVMAKYLQKLTRRKKLLMDLRLLSDTMRFYCRTDVDKSMAEDKHVFRLNDILTVAAKAKLELKFFPNASLEDFVLSPKSFEYSSFIESYLRYCMRFSEKTIKFFMKNAKEVLQYIADISGTTRAPESSGIFVLKNNI